MVNNQTSQYELLNKKKSFVPFRHFSIRQSNITIFTSFRSPCSKLILNITYTVSATFWKGTNFLRLLPGLWTCPILSFPPVCLKYCLISSPEVPEPPKRPPPTLGPAKEFVTQFIFSFFLALRTHLICQKLQMSLQKLSGAAQCSVEV